MDVLYCFCLQEKTRSQKKPGREQPGPQLESLRTKDRGVERSSTAERASTRASDRPRARSGSGRKPSHLMKPESLSSSQQQQQQQQPLPPPPPPPPQQQQRQSSFRALDLQAEVCMRGCICG